MGVVAQLALEAACVGGPRRGATAWKPSDAMSDTIHPIFVLFGITCTLL